MRKPILAVAVLMICSGGALAQDPDSPKGWGYFFGGVGAFTRGGTSALLHLGGGGEGLVYKGLGVGAEIGYIFPIEQPQSGVGLFSSNLAYHFGRERKVAPFVTGGYSLIFRESAAHGGNFGGGVQYWTGDRVGLRFEFRDHIFSSDAPHAVTFRVGISIR